MPSCRQLSLARVRQKSASHPFFYRQTFLPRTRKGHLPTTRTEIERSPK